MRQEMRPSTRPHRTPDPRVQRTRALVLQVTLDLLSEHGLGGLSIDEVSRRSGVAKTTIYRHWPTRADLILDACSQLSGQQPVPDTGQLMDDLTVLLTTFADLLRTARWSSVMPSIMDAAERDADVAAIHSAIQRDHAAPILAVLNRAKDRGALPASADPHAMTAALLGPLYYRRWFSREPLDSEFVRTIIAHVTGHSSARGSSPP